MNFLKETFPEKHSGPLVASSKFSGTIENMLGFSLAVKKLGLTNDDFDNASEGELSEISQRIKKFMGEIKRTPEEKWDIENFVADTLEPMADVIKFDSTPESTGIEKAKKARKDGAINKAAWITVDGQKMLLREKRPKGK